MKNNLQNKMQITYFLMASKNIVLITCVMRSCTGIFLIRVRDCDLSINYFCPMRQFRSGSVFFFFFFFYHNFRCRVTDIIL